jgi:hypothetical protein
MAPKRLMNVANQQFNKNVNQRGNIPKSLVSFFSVFDSFDYKNNFDNSTNSRKRLPTNIQRLLG